MSAWEPGWEMLVAFGTIGLAIGTLVLAAVTHQVASRTKETAEVSRATAKTAAADMRAQWRPAITLNEDPLMSYSPDDRELKIYLRNAGRGPALYLRAGLAIGEHVEGAEQVAADGTPLWNPVVVDRGEVFLLRFAFERRPDTCEVLVDYLDMADHPYSSRIKISRYATSGFDILRVTRIRLTEGGSVTPWGVPE